MLDVTKLQKLTVGDLNAFQRWRKERRKADIIETIKMTWGDAVPVEVLPEIERQLKMLPRLDQLQGDSSLDLECINYLVWLAGVKADPDLTLAQVERDLDGESFGDLLGAIFPQPDTVPAKKKVVKKKTVRKKKKKNN